MGNDKWIQLNADDAGQIARLAERAQSTFWGLLGCEVTHADEKSATISLEVAPSHLNLLGIVHGGVLMSMMDSAMGIVVMMAETKESALTTNLNTHFLANTGSGLLLCESELIHQSGRTLTLLAEVKDEAGKLLAWGSGTYRIL